MLFTFAATHFANHAVGLVGLEQMHAVQAARTAVTRSWPVTLVLLAALLAHAGLGLEKLARRRTLRMPWWETLQVSVALAIPFLLLPHIVNTRVAAWGYGVADTYLYELVRLWPERAVPQITLLLLVWLHGCIGLHYWLRIADGYRRVAPLLLVAAFALPALAVAGFVSSGRAAAEIMADPGALDALKERSHWPDEASSAAMARMRDATQIGFAMVLAAVAGVIVLRTGRRSAPAGLETGAETAASDAGAMISYLDGPACPLPAGMSVLEVSRSNAIPHASVCGGRGRCGTCRVRVLDAAGGRERLPPVTSVERVVLAALAAPDDVRLACQLRPETSLRVAVLVRPEHLGPDPLAFSEIEGIVDAHRRALAGAGSRSAVELRRDGRGYDPPFIAPFSGAAAAGLEFFGESPTVLFGGPVTARLFRWNGATLTVMTLPAGGHDALAVGGELDGLSVRGWSDDETTYVAVAAVPPTELGDLIARATGSGTLTIDPFESSDDQPSRTPA